MSIRRFVLNKLARNKIVQKFKEEGVTANFEILKDNEQYLEGLSEKLIEELEEVFAAENKEELIEELADLEEALSAFKHLLAITDKEVAAAREKKNKEKGSFSDRIFVHYIDVPASVKRVIKYCEDQPDKYPEVEIED